MELLLIELLQLLQDMEDQGILDTQEAHKIKLELWRCKDGSLGVSIYRRKEGYRYGHQEQ